MMPVDKKDLNTPTDKSHSASTRGVKRSTEEDGKAKIHETNKEKRVRPTEKDMGTLLEKEDVNLQKGEDEKELMEAQEELTDNSHSLSETSFMDLVDDAHRNIMSFLDLPSRLNLRVNKRLDRLHLSTKNEFKTIKLEIGNNQSTLIIDDHTLVRASNFTGWKDGLCRIAQNAFVNRISIHNLTVPNEEHCRLIDALFHLKSDCLAIDGVGERNLSNLPFSSFLTLAHNARKVGMCYGSGPLSAQELCRIRKTMLEGCRMETFAIMLEGSGMETFTIISDELRNAFMKECFGVTIEDVSEPVPGTIYHCADEFLELYNEDGDLTHFEGDLMTRVVGNIVRFEKPTLEKPDNELKLKLNELIEDKEDSDDEE